MPTLVTERGIVHYETYGRGRPVILLHGWLGSWALWRDTIEILGKQYRTYALDFFGFGDSLDRSADFSISNYVEVVYEFMDRLGIVKAPLIGHSMGGTVSLGVASRYPEKVTKVAIIGSPVQGNSLNFFLKLSGHKRIADLTFGIPFVLPAFVWGITHLAANDGTALHNMIKEDMTKVTVDSFFQSIGTLHRTDMTDQVAQLKMPLLGIYGRKDIIVNPKQSKVLLTHAPTAKEAWFENSGHFPMRDEPQRFYKIILDFLDDKASESPR